MYIYISYAYIYIYVYIPSICILYIYTSTSLCLYVYTFLCARNSGWTQRGLNPRGERVRENNWVDVIIQFMNNVSEHQRKYDIYKTFKYWNNSIFKYFDIFLIQKYLKYLNIKFQDSCRLAPPRKWFNKYLIYSKHLQNVNIKII